MQVSTGSSAGFTGTFIKWHYQPGQKYIQLLFETTTGMRLSLSRSKRLARSLIVGRTYRIKGQEHSVGGKTYVHEPTAIPLETKARISHAKRNTIIIITGAVLITAIASGLYVAASPNQTQTNVSDTGKVKAAVDSKPAVEATLPSTEASVTQTTEQATPAAQPSAATEPTAPAVTTTTPVKRTAAKKAASAVPVSPTPAPADSTTSPAPATTSDPAQNTETPGTETTTPPPADPPADQPPASDPPVQTSPPATDTPQ